MTKTGCGSGAVESTSFLQSKCTGQKSTDKVLTFLFNATYFDLISIYIDLIIRIKVKLTNLTSVSSVASNNWSTFFCCKNRDWKFEHPEHGHSTVSSPIPPSLMKDTRSMSYSMRLARVGGNSLFSKEVLYSLVITNVLSILIGAGIGWVVWK